MCIEKKQWWIFSLLPAILFIFIIIANPFLAYVPFASMLGITIGLLHSNLNKKLMVVAAGLALIAAVYVDYIKRPQENFLSQNIQVNVNRALQHSIIKDLKGNERKVDNNGNPYLVQLYKSNSEETRQQQKLMVKISNQSNVEVFAICIGNKSVANELELTQKHSKNTHNLTQYMVASGNIANDYASETFPMIFVVDGQNIVQEVYFGYAEGLQRTLQRYINESLVALK
jgi:hypothetical protein